MRLKNAYGDIIGLLIAAFVLFLLILILTQHFHFSLEMPVQMKNEVKESSNSFTAITHPHIKGEICDCMYEIFKILTWIVTLFVIIFFVTFAKALAERFRKHLIKYWGSGQ